MKIIKIIFLLDPLFTIGSGHVIPLWSMPQGQGQGRGSGGGFFNVLDQPGEHTVALHFWDGGISCVGTKV